MSMKMSVAHIFLITLALSASAMAANSPEQIEFFETKIRPVLAQECYACHSAAGKLKGGLALDSREGWTKGGKSGEVILKGNAAKSLLIQSIRHEQEDLEMPKNGAKLDARTIRDFETWVNMGAPDPRDKPSSPEEIAKDTDWAAVSLRRKNWWSFQPVQNPPLPVTKNTAWSEHPVDRFLLAAMEAKGLPPAADADPRALFRRLNFVLTGLPPTPEDADAFVLAVAATQNLSGAVDSAVERLLASPRFGERWARHWMDWMRYADTHGSEGDPAIPFAWRYRDYLVRALNADVPYPQLVREHIAGDLLAAPRTNRELGINESALGIAHYRMVMHGFTPTDALDEQATFTDNQIDTISKAFLGVTVSCARCHNHKFDAIGQSDFYALYGIMASCRPATIDVNLPERQTLHIEKLSELKRDIRAAISESWLTKFANSDKTACDIAIERLSTWKPEKKQPVPGAFSAWTRLAALPPEKWETEWRRMQDEWKQYRTRLAAFHAQDAIQRWDLRDGSKDEKKWVADGAGLAHGPTPAGEFHLFADGDRVLSGIFPAGTYSHLLSDKHRAVLASPNFISEGGKIWVRLRGGKSHARYVVRNYPRTGIIYPKHDMNSDADQWVNWNIDYWKGDAMYLEITTDSDQPVETSNIERSWFGAAEVLYAKNPNGPVPPDPMVSLLALCPENTPVPKSPAELNTLYANALRRCVEAWRSGGDPGRDSDKDDEAEFLAAFVQKDLLPNRISELSSAAPLVAVYRKLESEVPVPTRAPGLIEGFAFDQALFVRGNHKQPAATVPRRFLEAIDARPYEPGPAHSGRLNLAESLVAPDNPLTSRVIVNRLWQYIYGQGLVTTPDNFGHLGELPSHPELLDYLAARFQSEGGSLKKMIRLLLTARAFRLDHRASKEAESQDPENKWLTHFSMQRLDAEAIRDSMLALSGKLDAALGGASVDGGSNRRSIYVKIIRNNLDPLLTAFDFPVPSATRGRRDATNVPAQSLAMLNAPLVGQWASDWLKRVSSDPKAKTDTQRVQRLFAEAFCREPGVAELEECLAYVRGAPDSKPETGWLSLAQALFNAKEFIYVR